MWSGPGVKAQVDDLLASQNVNLASDPQHPRRRLCVVGTCLQLQLLTLRRLKQKDHEIEARLSYIAQIQASLYYIIRPLKMRVGQSSGCTRL